MIAQVPRIIGFFCGQNLVAEAHPNMMNRHAVINWEVSLECLVSHCGVNEQIIIGTES